MRGGGGGGEGADVLIFFVYVDVLIYGICSSPGIGWGGEDNGLGWRIYGIVLCIHVLYEYLALDTRWCWDLFRWTGSIYTISFLIS